MIQKILSKQGMKFKLNTKVTKGDDSGEIVKINVEAAKGGKEEIVYLFNLSIYFHPLTCTVARCRCRISRHWQKTLHGRPRPRERGIRNRRQGTPDHRSRIQDKDTTYQGHW